MRISKAVIGFVVGLIYSALVLLIFLFMKTTITGKIILTIAILLPTGLSLFAIEMAD